MRRAERLFRLIAEMRRMSSPRAADLAERLEVSIRTIYRDVAHLQASGVPIDGEPGVGYLLRPGFDLPPITFSTEQLEALAAGAAFVEAAGDADLSAAAREARAKIDQALPEPARETWRLSPISAARRAEARLPDWGAEIRRSIRRREVVEVDYTDGAGRPTTRLIRPLALSSFTDGWLVGAWCELRSDLRDFRVDRIRRWNRTGRTFVPAPGADLPTYLSRTA